MDLQTKVTPIIFHDLPCHSVVGPFILERPENRVFRLAKAETGRWDLAAKASLAADSSPLPGRVAAAPPANRGLMRTQGSWRHLRSREG